MNARNGAPVIVLTALELEYEAIRECLTGVHRLPPTAGTVFETGRLPGGRGEVTIAVAGEGTRGAAVLAERAIAVFQPRALILVGVAGALKDDIELGDVVVATKVYAYHGGKEEDGDFLARPQAWNAPYAVEQLARVVDRAGAWARQLTVTRFGHPPAVHFKPIASGEVVLNSRDAPQARQLHRIYNDAVAIETEGAGVAEAGHLNDLPVLTVRGISDKADGDKRAADEVGWQPVAAAHAAAFALALAAELLAHDPEELSVSIARPRKRSVNPWIAAILALVVAAGLVVYGEHWLSQALPENITGSVVCQSGRPVVGVWIAASSGQGDSGFAHLGPPGAVGFSHPIGPAGTYSYRLPHGGSYAVHVGCGGSASHWASRNYSPLLSGRTVSLRCADRATSQGNCAVAR